MKQILNLLALVTAFLIAREPWAAEIAFTGTNGNYSASSGPISQPIYDYPSPGLAYPLSFSQPGIAQITDISVTFTTVGGWNGDLYAYLSHGNGLSVLLNKVGASAADPDGFAASGFTNITLSFSATTDIHGVPTPTSGGGPYAADGRLNYTDPDTARNNTLSVFNGADPNGSWTLFFSDLSPVYASELTGFRVDITAIPEPPTVTFGFLAAAFVVSAVRARRAQHPLHVRSSKFGR
jgi:hypothetical protein